MSRNRREKRPLNAKSGTAEQDKREKRTPERSEDRKYLRRWEDHVNTAQCEMTHKTRGDVNKGMDDQCSLV